MPAENRTCAALKEIVEEPSGAMDSSNVTFTLSHTPAPSMFRLYLNGIEQSRFRQPRTGAPDYTRAGTIITMHAAPKATDQMSAEYFITA